jgi:hypothetical protein
MFCQFQKKCTFANMNFIKENMSLKSIFVLISVFYISTLVGQTVTGKVIDITTGETLAYVNIGVVDQPRGTITDETGTFALETNGLSAETIVRFSMIGYRAQTFTVRELSDNNKISIKLESIPVSLSEVVIKPKKTRKAGMTKCAMGPICGWGGEQLGKGWEIGLKIELGELPALLKSLHVRVHKNSFDTCLFRLHVRNVVNELPGNELLTQNIIIPVTKKSGWAEIDLSKHQLVFQGNIFLSLEWVAVKGVNKNRLISVKSDGKKLPPSAVVLFNMSKTQGGAYSKWGSEAQWVQINDSAPSFYLTVM